MTRSRRDKPTLSPRSDERKRRERQAREIAWPVESPPPAVDPVVLTDRATSVTAANPFEVPAKWWPVIDKVWCERKLAAAVAWQERAEAELRQARRAEALNARWRMEADRDIPVADSATPRKRALYAKARARTIALERSAVVATCGQRKLAVRCACGPALKSVGCGQILLCDKCRRPYYRKIRRRALAAVTARLAEAATSWHRGGRRRGKRPMVVLVTLTIPRMEGERAMPLMERQRRLVDGWRKLRQWLHRRIGAFPFVCLPELTPGSDGTGHLHYHAICVWPWWDWQESQAEWRRATGLSDANPPDMRVVNDPRRAAHYVAKYATKGAASNREGMTADLLADFVATYYGKRRISPSVGWWVPMPPPRCPCCGDPIAVTERPAPVVEAAAAWRARRGLAGVPPSSGEIPDRDWRQVAPRW